MPLAAAQVATAAVDLRLVHQVERLRSRHRLGRRRLRRPAMLSTRAIGVGRRARDHADAEAISRQLAAHGRRDLRFVDLRPDRVVQLRIVRAGSGPR